MKAGHKLHIEQRRALVLDYFAKHPRATFRDAAGDLDIAVSTIHADFKAAIADISARTKEAYAATCIARNELIAEAHMPLALAGKTRSAEIVLAADKRTAEIIGLDAPLKREDTLKVLFDQAAAAAADEFGLDPDEVLAEAQRHIATAAR